MKNVKLKELVDLFPGKNQTRIKKDEEISAQEVYDKAAFDSDLEEMATSKYQGTMNRKEEISSSLNEGDIVINNATHIATLISKGSTGKILPNNFTKVVFKEKQFDAYYFLYLFNEYKEISKQKERELQGTTVVQRIPSKALGNFDIPMIPLDKQEQLGTLYFQSISLKRQLQEYTKTMEEFTLEVISEELTKIGENR